MSEEKMTLKQNRGFFEIRGIVFNTKSENSFKETEKGFRMSNFGVRINAGKNVFLSLNSNKPKMVYYNVKGKDGKNKTESVEYGKRIPSDGRLIGVGIKLERDGETEYYHPYDAWQFLKENLKDGTSVFIKGSIEFSSWKDKDGNVRRSQKLIPNGIYITSEDIDFESEKFEERAIFTQDVVYLDAEKPEEEGGLASLKVGVVGFNSWEEVELPCVEKVARTLKSALKPYNAINVNGVIDVEEGVEIVEEKDEDDGWGESKKVGVQRKPAVAKLMVNGAERDTINTEDYSRKIVEQWIEYIQEIQRKRDAEKPDNFKSQDSGDWGESSKESASAW